MSDHSAVSAPAGQDAHGAHGHGAEHEHPTWKQYKWVALVLSVITVVEVWVYYTPFADNPKVFNPTLIFMSAVKFFIVCAYYMHLKYDHWIFKRLFLVGLIIATCTLFALMFLFHKLAV